MTTMTTNGKPRELAHREADGVEVALLWYPDTDIASVMVSDGRTGDVFELVLGDDDRALDVFDHPYAHAAHRGLEFRLPSRQRELAEVA